MSASAAAGGLEARGAALASPASWLIAGALVAAAVAIQLRFGIMDDVAWLIDCAERWLAGAVPYRDFFEINPPASLLLYLPAGALAKAVGLRSELVVSAFGFLSVATALGLSAGLLQRCRSAGTSAVLAAIVALVILPGESFCERDHLAAVLGVPFLAAALARAERTRVPWALALAAGVGAGMMASIKPPYALIGVLLAGFLMIRVGWRAVLRAPEYYAAAVVGLAYVASVGPFFPHYVATVLPLGVAVYVPDRESFQAIAASPGALLIGLLFATSALAAGERAAKPGFVVASLATLGAAVAYFVQGKGWVYQAVPGLMFATLAGGFALDRRPILAIGLGAVAAAVAVSLAHGLGPGLAAGLVVGLAVDATQTRNLRLSAERIGALGFAAAVGTACGVCLIERPLTPELERALTQLGPNLTLGAVSEDMGLGFPLSRRIDATWVMRANSLYVNAAVDHLLTKYPADAPLRARVAPYAERERTEFIEDIFNQRPDALLVGPIHTRIHEQIWTDPRLQAAMAAYQRVGVEEKPKYTAELWVRKDFVAAKPQSEHQSN